LKLNICFKNSFYDVGPCLAKERCISGARIANILLFKCKEINSLDDDVN
jgi:hypothetical protein